MEYRLWTEENIKELQNDANRLDFLGKRMINEVLDIIRIANSRHSEKMLKKDVEIARLEAKLEFLEAERNEKAI